MTTLSTSLDDLGIEADTLQWLKARAAADLPPIYEVPLKQARTGLEMAQAQVQEKPRALSDDIEIPMEPDKKVSVRLLRPSGVPGKRPIVVYMHGGGWVLGSPDTHDRLAREITAASGAAVVMVRYSRSPEARYPTALEEAYAVTAWLAENGEVLGLNSSRLAVAGDSSGAALAAGVAILAKRRNGPAIRHQTLIYPVTDGSCSLPSYSQFENGPNLTRKAMQWYWDQYAPSPEEKANDTASVLNASVEDLTGLPPALVITAEFDVLRDEGEAFARKLIQAGVEVTATRYLGTIHGFAVNNALAKTPAARAVVVQVGAALKAALA
ncbi:MAG: alpha/beta hydrolase [Desulfovibrio sp.]|nr:alpha/beta hydrolase [Desulfovibrio sp.]MBI4958372.1 alpha/beta hydrolase [Desulfovibrio sp.]